MQSTTEAKGWVGVTVQGAPGANVTVWEGPVQLAAATLDAAGAVSLPRLAPWLCDRRERTVTVTDEAGGSGSAVVATPSCAKRFSARVAPKRPRAGKPLTVRLTDTWGHGDLAPRVCARGPAGQRCGKVAFGGERRAAFRLRPRSAGRWVVTVDGRRRARTRVRPRRGGLRILATGDSMIQYVDFALERRLERGARRVRSDAHISTGISKPSMLDWPAHAERTARAWRPDATVVFLGANDGFPINGDDCCGDAWVKGYAARARRMMRSYSRRGAGTVYWLTLPVPDRAEFKPIYRAVNRAIVAAARRLPDVVRVVDTEEFFTPGGAYRSSVRWKGRTVTVRQSDGVHLNQTGAAIAAALVIRAMRRDGVL